MLIASETHKKNAYKEPSKYYCCWLLDLLFCYFFSLFFIMLFFPLSFDVASGEALMLIHCLIERNKKLWKIWEETVTWRRNRQHYRIQRAIVECLVSIKLNNSYAVCVSVCGDAVMEYLSVCIAHSTHGMDGRTRAWWTFTVFLYNTSNYLIHSHLFWPSGSGCHIRWTKMMFFYANWGASSFQNVWCVLHLHRMNALQEIIQVQCNLSLYKTKHLMHSGAERYRDFKWTIPVTI